MLVGVQKQFIAELALHDYQVSIQTPYSPQRRKVRKEKC
jgi:hypothetical protein